MPGNILARAEMRQRHAERRRLARGLLIRNEQLLPRSAHALMGGLVNVNMTVLVETEQRRLRVIARTVRNTWLIAVRQSPSRSPSESRVWRSNSAMLTACSGGAASWRFPRQLEKDL